MVKKIKKSEAPLTLTTKQVNVICFGNSEGSATVIPAGGTEPYNYFWNTAPEQTTAKASNLSIGPYRVTVTDNNGSTATADVLITQEIFAKSFYHPDKYERIYSYDPLIKRDFPISVNRRFLFHYWENNLTDKQREFEIIIDEDPIFIESEGKYIYVPEKENLYERLIQVGIDQYLQVEIDKKLMKTICYKPIPYISELLDYQLSKYDDRLKRLKDLKALFEVDVGFYINPKEYKKGHQDRCREWAKDLISKLQPKIENEEQKSKTELIDTLSKACLGLEEYNSIKEWFIKEGLCNPDPFYYKVSKKGDKSILVNYIKDLHQKGYSKELKHVEIIAIAKNCFGVKLGIDTVKRAILTGKPEIPHFTS